MNNFKIGDNIKPKADYPQVNKISSTFKPLGGRIVDFVGSKEKQFPVIINDEGDLYTVNPDIYEAVEAK